MGALWGRRAVSLILRGEEGGGDGGGGRVCDLRGLWGLAWQPDFFSSSACIIPHLAGPRLPKSRPRNDAWQ